MPHHSPVPCIPSLPHTVPPGTGRWRTTVTGDIYLADANGDHAVPIVAGPTSDLYPGFLRDGTKLAFLRTEYDTTLTLMVAHADGTAPVSLATKVDAADDAPDGATMVVLQTIDGHPAISIVATDGSTARTLDLGGIEPAGWVDWRPTDGKELIFTGHPHAGTLDLGLYAIRADGTGLRTIGAVSTTESDPSSSAPTQLSFQNLNLSPDGSSLWYTNWEPNDAGSPDDSTHVRDLTTGEDRRVRFDPRNPQDTQALFWTLSPDGTTVLYESQGQLVHRSGGREPARPGHRTRVLLPEPGGDGFLARRHQGLPDPELARRDLDHRRRQRSGRYHDRDHPHPTQLAATGPLTVRHCLHAGARHRASPGVPSHPSRTGLTVLCAGPSSPAILPR